MVFYSYFTVNCEHKRKDGCPCIYFWIVGVYCGTDGVGNVKFVIWTENKGRNIRKPLLKIKYIFGHDAKLY